MRWLCLLPALAMIGCDRTENSFAVEDGNRVVQSATLKLCGAETPMERVGNTFSLSLPSTCEGEGQITLIYRDGRTEACHIGYVTNGLEQHFLFRAEQSSCSPM
jgi:hypothetical protein